MTFFKLMDKKITPFYTKKLAYYDLCLYVFHALRPSQQFFSHVSMFSCLAGLNQYKAEDQVSCSRTQHSVSSEFQTMGIYILTSKQGKSGPRLYTIAGVGGTRSTILSVKYIERILN